MPAAHASEIGFASRMKRCRRVFRREPSTSSPEATAKSKCRNWYGQSRPTGAPHRGRPRLVDAAGRRPRDRERPAVPSRSTVLRSPATTAIPEAGSRAKEKRRHQQGPQPRALAVGIVGLAAHSRPRRCNTGCVSSSETEPSHLLATFARRVHHRLVVAEPQIRGCSRHDDRPADTPPCQFSNSRRTFTLGLPQAANGNWRPNFVSRSISIVTRKPPS